LRDGKLRSGLLDLRRALLDLRARLFDLRAGHDLSDFLPARAHRRLYAGYVG
jgi:hypothetical protein